MLCGLDVHDPIQRPLNFGTQRWVVRRLPQRLQRRLCLRPHASQRPGCANAHVEELVFQRLDQLRYSGRRGRTDAREGLTRRPSDARNRIAQGPCEFVCRRRPLSDRWTPGPQPRTGARADPRCARASTRDGTEGPALSPNAPSARAASRATNESSSLRAPLSAGCIDSVSGARSIRMSTA